MFIRFVHLFMQRIEVNSISVEALYATLRSIIKEELQTAWQSELQDKLYSPNEACKLFNPKISRVTLDKWAKDGKVKRYQVGGRVFFRYQEIIEVAKHLKPYQV